jgi:SulP family sulfate permease
MIFLRNLRFKEYNLKNEILSGLTVALALVPEAAAFSIIAGVSPLILRTIPMKL